MAAIKTVATGADVREFINTFADTEQKKNKGTNENDNIESDY